MRSKVRNLIISFISVVSLSLLLSGTNQPEEVVNEDKRQVTSIIEGKEPVNWVFCGNSITQGAKHTHGMRGYPEIFSERIRWELQRPYDFIINTAISGHTTQNIVNDFEKRVARFRPKVLVLKIGTNDAALDRNISLEKFGSNLVQLIDQIREVKAIPVVMSPNIIISEKSPERDRLYQYVEKMEQVVKELLNDPLHPNGYGHQEIAIALFKELSIFDPNAQTCGGEYYEGGH